MIKSSEEYKKGIVADSRRITMKAVVDISDPDLVVGEIIGSNQTEYSRPEQLHDKNMTMNQYQTLELNRWLLDDSLQPIDTLSDLAEIGWVSEDIADSEGYFVNPQSIEITVSGIEVLQTFSIYFSQNSNDGYPVELSVQLEQGGQVYFDKTISDNKEYKLSFDGFTIYAPDLLRIIVNKWSVPYRHARVAEALFGIYEEWQGDEVADLQVEHQADITCLKVPYGTAKIKLDNSTKRFEPRTKTSLFKSIEERQGIDLYLGLRLSDGSTEYKKLGIFYQFDEGWKTGNYDLTIEWNLVDVLGLLVDREYIVPETLPTTFEGWISSIISHLGNNFEGKYQIDANYKDIELLAQKKEDIEGMTCGDILRYACMAVGVWARADAETGFLTCEPVWNEGNKITLDNLNSYPEIQANSSIASISFKIFNDFMQQPDYVFSGNSTSSSTSVTVSNPFIPDYETAQAAARRILQSYGGQQIKTSGRGDMCSEIGDVDTVWIDGSSALSARRTQQDFSFSTGVLKDCTSTLIQPDGAFLFENRVKITESGQWQAPAGIDQIRIILVGKGEDGKDGENGTWSADGADGADGAGGKIFSEIININAEQIFDITIGNDTIFGLYSSANGQTFSNGYTDLNSGEVFGRSAVKNPLPGSGDGGQGGAGGSKGYTQTISTDTAEGGEPTTETISSPPTSGRSGTKGATGCVVIWYGIGDGA